MKLMIDTWAWIEILTGTEKGKKAKELMKGKTIYTTSGNTYELRYKLRERYGKKADEIIRSIIGNSVIVSINDKISERASEIKFSKKGDIGAVDCFTLAAGELIGAKVVTGDPHMKGMSNVIYL
ncbi:MAG: PIN domain-containing protein [Candidatus Altiarchaeota archaeon]|nr:PIN domain-containing protein [Candidatus Altiarchaeota archaeon]